MAVAVTLPMFLPPPPFFFQRNSESDRADDNICRNRLSRGANEALFRLPMGDLVAKMGRIFLGKPYTPYTLEESGPERLVVNLREFDCVTFCETSLALARSIKLHVQSIEGYRAQLQLIRYRGGAIRGYCSRLHYFSDWIGDNEKKGVVKDITRELGGVLDKRLINFMSRHRNSYPRLAEETTFEELITTEERLSIRKRFLIPKEHIGNMLNMVNNGDIIGIASSEEGLDVAHTGIALKEGGITKLLHAPTVGQSVQISQGSLSDYLAVHSTQSGVIVARPVDPVAHDV